MANERSDGELGSIQDYLASEQLSARVKKDLQSDIDKAKGVFAQRMQKIMHDLEKIDTFWDERFVYGFKENSSKDVDLLIVNLPIIDQEGSAVSIRYLVASRIGFGYVRFLFDDTEVDKIGNISLKSPFSKFQAETRLPADHYTKLENIESLYALNFFFQECSSKKDSDGLIKEKFKFRNELVLSTPDQEYRGGQLTIKDEYREEGWVKFDFSEPENENQFQEDLQYILDRLAEERQKQIERENIRLAKAEDRLKVANDMTEMLSMDDEALGNKRKGLRFPSLKRKRG